MSMSIQETPPSTETSLPQARGPQEVQKTQKVAGQIFILMRHADKQGGSNPSLKPEGKIRAHLSAQAIQNIAQDYGKSDIQLIVSTLKRSQETATYIAETVGVDPSSLHVEPKIREREGSPLPKALVKEHPQRVHYKSLTDEKEKFYTDPSPGAESRSVQFERMKEGITASLDKYQNPTVLPVIVSHQSVIRSFFQGLGYQNQFQDANPTFLKNSKYCEIFVVERTQEGNFVGIERRRIELAPTTV